ncbi:hypothetical protein [Kiloniella sp.]|uniref:hypothetical protein n=1 Tax=Kiloniella sp. TaxID=1938587 RepID=UPI003B01B5B8
MSDVFYPELGENDAWKVNTAVNAAKADGSYLSSSECPYDAETIAILKDLIGSEEAVASSDISELTEASIDDINLEDEVVGLLLGLKKFKEELQNSDKTEMNSYYRLTVPLIEKLVVLKERASGINEVNAFTQAVLTVMEDELSPDQATTIISRLKGVIGEKA